MACAVAAVDSGSPRTHRAIVWSYAWESLTEYPEQTPTESTKRLPYQLRALSSSCLLVESWGSERDLAPLQNRNFRAACPIRGALDCETTPNEPLLTFPGGFKNCA